MDRVTFDKICESLKDFVKECGCDYNIIPLEGTKKDETTKCLIVDVNGQNYLQVDSAPCILWFNLFPQTKYQRPKFHCFPDTDGNYMLVGKEITNVEKSDFTISILLQNVFGDIKQRFEDRPKVAEILNKHIKGYVFPEQIGYDICEKSYYLLDWDKDFGGEFLFFSNYFRSLRKRKIHSLTHYDHYIAKYTSLETALMMLNSKKMRMMSVTAMNDRMEIGHLYGKISNDKSAYLDNKTIINFARKRYITSFTSKIDDLTMWRLYGDNGKGVCLLFHEPFESGYFYPVDYLGDKSAILKESNKICEELKKHGFCFTFKSLQTIWQYFLKPSGFSDENELRYLRIDNNKPDGYSLASNDIISTYRDLLLIEEEGQEGNTFPAHLVGIILGPNVKNVEINKLQLEALAFEKGLAFIEGVVSSNIDYYI